MNLTYVVQQLRKQSARVLFNYARKSSGRALDQLQLKNRDFTVISNDCWGAEVYKHFDLPFNTPFIGLMLMAPCYLEFLARPRHYAAQPLVFQPASRYDEINRIRANWKHTFPIATLGTDEEDGKSIEIQFLHYESEAEAREKWNRRVSRMNWDNLFVKFDGSKDFATTELVHEFDQLPYKRLAFLREEVPGVACAIVVPTYTTNGALQFERARQCYDLVGWLNGSSMKSSRSKRLYNQVFFPSN